MRNKVLHLVVLLLCALLALTACGDNEQKQTANHEYPQELISLAKMEAINLAPTLEVLDKVITGYQSWERGEITREQLAEQLASFYPEVNAMQDDYLQFRKDTNFAQTPAVKHEAYQEGLYQGEMIRKRLMYFIRDVSDPQKDDASLKQSFESNISANIEKRVSELEATLSEFKEQGLLK